MQLRVKCNICKYFLMFNLYLVCKDCVVLIKIESSFSEQIYGPAKAGKQKNFCLLSQKSVLALLHLNPLAPSLHFSHFFSGMFLNLPLN